SNTARAAGDVVTGSCCPPSKSGGGNRCSAMATPVSSDNSKKPMSNSHPLRFTSFISVAGGLQQIRVIGWHPAEGVTGADLGDGALIAIHTAVVPHLQEKRAVAEAITALDTLGAADTQPLVDRVFVIGVFDIGALDCGGGAQAVLRAGVQTIGLR